jgi:hypothetical protein
MSETKFTPGPWRLEIKDHGDWLKSAQVYNAHGFMASSAIIKVEESRQDGESWLEMQERIRPAQARAQEESIANMRLFAAAPDLYAALDTMAKAYRHEHGLEGAYDPCITQAEAALKKARGE